jgi:hypothetical protein
MGALVLAGMPFRSICVSDILLCWSRGPQTSQCETMLPHGLEPWTSRLLAERSNQLSYESRCAAVAVADSHAALLPHGLHTSERSRSCNFGSSSAAIKAMNIRMLKFENPCVPCRADRTRASAHLSLSKKCRPLPSSTPSPSVCQPVPFADFLCARLLHA